MARLLSKIAVTAAALSLAGGPALAQSSALSLRASTAAKHKSDIGPPIIAIIGLIAIVGGGIYVAVDEPDSP